MSCSSISAQPRLLEADLQRVAAILTRVFPRKVKLPDLALASLSQVSAARVASLPAKLRRADHTRLALSARRSALIIPTSVPLSTDVSRLCV